jgi:DNA invertase Pin-like site-specific DNA recombinase
MGRIIGYARDINENVNNKNIQNQVEFLENAGELECELVYTDENINDDMNRPVLQKMLNELKEGDIVCIDELYRLSCNYEDYIKIRKTIDSMGASVWCPGNDDIKPKSYVYDFEIKGCRYKRLGNGVYWVIEEETNTVFKVSDTEYFYRKIMHTFKNQMG